MAAFSSWLLDSVDTKLDLNSMPLRFSGEPPVSSVILLSSSVLFLFYEFWTDFVLFLFL